MTFDAEFLYYDCPGAGHAHCASIAALRDGGLLAAWYVYPEAETCDGRIVLARRTGNGPWSLAKPIPLAVSGSAGNPVLFETPDGGVWLHFVTLSGQFWDTAAWYAARSDDRGRSFNTPIRITREDGLMVRHAPILRGDGVALMPVYSDRTKRSFLYSSAPPYVDWREAYAFGDAPVIQGCLMAEDQRLIQFFRPSDGRRHPWRSISSDGGESWSEPIRMTLPNPLSGIAGFTLNGRVAMVYNHTEKHQRHPLAIATSMGPLSDWSAPRPIDDAEFEVSYPSFTVDSAYDIHGVFTYNRRFIKYVTFDREWLDGRAT